MPILGKVASAVAVCAVSLLPYAPKTAFAQTSMKPWIIPVSDGDPEPSPLPVFVHNTRSSQQLREIGDDPSRFQGKTSDPGTGRYSADLTLDRAHFSAAAGASLHPTVTLTNTGEVEISYTEGGLRCGWQILNAQGAVVYDYARGRMIPHFVLIRRLPPGKSEVFTAQIPLKDSEGNALAPGRYTLRAKPSVGLPFSVETAFTIGDNTQQASAPSEKAFHRTLQY